jgi:hypothetical protein
LNIANGSTLTSSAGIVNVGRDFTNAGTFSHNNGSVVMMGTAVAQTITPNGSPFFNLTTTQTTPVSVTTAGNLTVDGTLALNSGNLIFNGFTLTLKGPFTTADLANQYLVASPTSSLIINGPFGIPPIAMGPLNFAPGSRTLHTLTLNRTGGGSATVGTPITVTNALNLTNGTLANSTTNNVTLNSGSALYRTGDGFLTAIPAGGPYALSYGSNAPGNYSTEFELQGNLSPNIHNGVDGTLTQTSNLNLFGVLSFGTNSSYNTGTSILTVKSISDTQGGSIGRIQNGTFSGPITVERFMSAKGAMNRYIPTPRWATWPATLRWSGT